MSILINFDQRYQDVPLVDLGGAFFGLINPLQAVKGGMPIRIATDWFNSHWHEADGTMPNRHTVLHKKGAQAMGYAELIERLQSLPQDKQAEVFDFVEFLFARAKGAELSGVAHGDWTDAEFSMLAMAQALRGSEDDSVVYTRTDLREQWQ